MIRNELIQACINDMTEAGDVFVDVKYLNSDGDLYEIKFNRLPKTTLAKGKSKGTNTL